MYDRPRLFIDGDWTDPAKGTTYEVIEAATGEPFATTAMATAEDVDAAVAAARAALSGPWSRMTQSERAQLLGAFAAALGARRKETAALVTRENGMPISLSHVVNGIAPGFITGYYAELAASLSLEETRPSPTGGNTLVVREPVGVVAAVTPWNYPQPLAVMKIAPALAAGCTVVLKPAPETALDAFVFADAAAEVGLPPGVLNVLPGDRDAGAHLVEHPGVDKVAFTGSTGAGRVIGSTAGRLLRPATLELGGKSVSLVAEDADLELVSAKLLEVSLPNNGQTCHAATRILAPRSRYAEVVEAVTSTVAALTVGDPLDGATQVGPLVSQPQQQRVADYIRQGRDLARLTTGGGVPDRPGWYVEPTVFADVDNDCVIAQEEIFGPVLVITPYADEDEAIALANDSDYGLGGVVWSADEEHGLALARRISSGTVGVNHYELHINAPFGGVRSSGLGRELGPEGLEPYLVAKSIYRR
ncbi:aldehyde dehydrogenase (NAD+) [Nocardioides sp. YR527]|uniref:aldehyde dehydrogenase n=1 Tax=Nocardioides sp. YR527 TaxID=1881028 RepID=UPI00088F3BEB|nr:aldehyde dehydrogenase [Nocardioides sp. YR527]SDK65910.1 aldehyde dehydrogenase (NAD+) [Nocardioides sp. YR527]